MSWRIIVQTVKPVLYTRKVAGLLHVLVKAKLEFLKNGREITFIAIAQVVGMLE